MVESNGPKTVTALWAMTSISVLFMSLRFFCKTAFTRKIGIDDAILLLAWILSVIYAALITVSVNFGVGKHSVDIPPGNEVPMTKFLFLGEFFALIAIPTSKTSFAVTLLRIVGKEWQKWFIWFIIVTMNIVMWLCGILLLCQCQPIQKNWNTDLPGSCWQSKVQDNYSIFAGAYSAFLDFVLASFPCLIVWKLQMGMREKIGVILAMSLGFLAGITAAVKTSFLPGVGKFNDLPFSLAELIIWSIAETSVTIVAASIPFFRALIKHASTRGHSAPRRQSYRLGSYEGTIDARSVRINVIQSNNSGSDESVEIRSLPIQGVILKGSEVHIEYSSN